MAAPAVAFSGADSRAITVLAGPPGPPTPTFSTNSADPALRAKSTGTGLAIEVTKDTNASGPAMAVHRSGAADSGSDHAILVRTVT